MAERIDNKTAANIQYCLDILEDAVGKLTDEQREIRDDAMKALRYLGIMFKGDIPEELMLGCHSVKWWPK